MNLSLAPCPERGWVMPISEGGKRGERGKHTIRKGGGRGNGGREWHRRGRGGEEGGRRLMRGGLGRGVGREERRKNSKRVGRDAKEEGIERG